MKTCKDCFYKGKTPGALSAFECCYDAPVAVPMVGQMPNGMPGIGGVGGVRPPVSDTTNACHKHKSALSLT